jgi:peptide deformylase
MAVLDILQVGHPVLRERAEELSPEKLLSDEWQAFIDNLVETMRAANGAGLAANQVGTLRRICAVEVRADNPRYPEKEPIPLTILVNPVITPLDESTMSSYEGCLSVPNLRGRVTRNAHIEITYLDREGTAQKRIAQGIQAVTYQHECDHLDGRLFLDRVTDPTSLTTWENFSAFHR